MENVEPLEYVYEMIELLVAKYGALGIAAAMFAESAGVPFVSMIVILTAGTLILGGSVSFWSIFLASTIGITLGSIFSYLMGWFGSKVGRVVRNSYYNNTANINNISRPHRSKIIGLWNKYGSFSIFLGQLWGFTRTFISFPAGAMHMNIYLFIAYTFLGGAIFSLATIGFSLALTSTMGFTIKILKALAVLSPWLLAIPILIVVTVICFFLFRKRKLNLQSLQIYWSKLKVRITKKIYS